MKQVLRMTLKVDSGKKKTWTLEDPKVGLNKQQVENALNTAIQEEYFKVNNAYATEIADYYIYETNTVEVN